MPARDLGGSGRGEQHEVFVAEALHRLAGGQIGPSDGVEIGKSAAQGGDHRFTHQTGKLQLPAWGVGRDDDPIIGGLARGQGGVGEALPGSQIEQGNSEARTNPAADDRVGHVGARRGVDDADEIDSRFKRPVHARGQDPAIFVGAGWGLAAASPVRARCPLVVGGPTGGITGLAPGSGGQGGRQSAPADDDARHTAQDIGQPNVPTHCVGGDVDRKVAPGSRGLVDHG